MAHGPQGCWLVEPLPISGPKCDTGVTPLTSWGPDWKMGLPQGGSDLRWQGSQGSVSVPWPTKRYHDFFEVYIVLCVHLFCSIYIYLSNLLPIPTYLSILSERKRERENKRRKERERNTDKTDGFCCSIRESTYGTLCSWQWRPQGGFRHYQHGLSGNPTEQRCAAKNCCFSWLLGPKDVSENVVLTALINWPS